MDLTDRGSGKGTGETVGGGSEGKHGGDGDVLERSE